MQDIYQNDNQNRDLRTQTQTENNVFFVMFTMLSFNITQQTKSLLKASSLSQRKNKLMFLASSCRVRT